MSASTDISPTTPDKRASTSTTVTLLRSAMRAIGFGGLMGVAVIAPNALNALEQLGVFTEDTPRAKRQRLLAELRRQGLVIETREDDQIRLQLTVKGIHRLQRTEIDELTVARPKRWDKHWRMVVFDIPTAHKQQRYIFISQLRRMGFVMVRQSTWYHPYPCFDVIDTLIKYCALSNYVTLAEISRLDDSTTRKLLRSFPQLATKL